MPISDEEILERFGRRFAVIDRQVPPTPPFAARRRARGFGRGWLVLAAAVLSVLVVGGGPYLAGRLPAALPSAPGSPSAVAIPAPTGPSELDLRVGIDPPVLPNGVVLGGLDPYFNVAARIDALDGSPVASWDVPPFKLDPPPNEPIVFVEGGTYRLTVWRFSVIDNVDTGERVTSPPVDACSTVVTLSPSGPTRLLATFAPREACSFLPRLRADASLPSSSIEPTQAATLAAAHGSGDGWTSVAAGPFVDLDAMPYTAGRSFPIKAADLVWAVRFARTTDPICVAPNVVPGRSQIPSCQSPGPGVSVVYLDYETGTFLGMEDVPVAP